MFESWAKIFCIECGKEQCFHAGIEVNNLNDSIFFSQDWTINSIVVLNFNGICPKCKYKKAA